MKLLKFFCLLYFNLFIFYSVPANCTVLIPFIFGASGSTLIHESGHYFTAKYLGAEIYKFKPYPSKIVYETKTGVQETKWVGGFVSFKPFSGDNADRNSAITSAMGSVTNLFAALALTPLLPKLHDEFSRESLDSLLLFSCWDWPLYTTIALINPTAINDWNQVSNKTNIALYWYLVMGVISSSLVNSQINKYRHRANENKSFEPLDIVFNFNF